MRICLRRREFIAAIGGAAAWPLAVWALQGDRVRRIGVLIGLDENDPLAKARISAFTQALAGLGWADGRNTVRWCGRCSPSPTQLERRGRVAQRRPNDGGAMVYPGGRAAMARCQSELECALGISVRRHWQAEMLAQSMPRIFQTKDAAPLQLRHDRINEFIKGGGEVRRHQYEAVASAINKPFLHNIGDRSCVPACKEVATGHGDLIVNIPQCEILLASLLIGDLRMGLN